MSRLQTVGMIDIIIEKIIKEKIKFTNSKKKTFYALDSDKLLFCRSTSNISGHKVGNLDIRQKREKISVSELDYFLRASPFCLGRV